MFRPIPCLATLLLSLALPPVAFAADAPLGIPVEGPMFYGHLVAAESAPALTLRFSEGDATRDLPAADLAVWGGFVDPGPGVEIVLAGGGLLLADAPRIDDEHLHAASATFGNLKVPLKLVAGIVLRRPTDRARGDALVGRILALAGQADRVLLDNGDELTGTIAALDDARLRLQTDVGTLDVETDKLAAVIFNPILIDQPKLAGLWMQVGFRDGSRATAIELAADKTAARIKLAGGVELTAPTDAIVALQPLGGRVIYLSDLKPSSYRHIPFLDLAWPFQADKSVLGAQLRSAGQVYLKGLGMHSPARITFDLEGAFRRFAAEVAIDAEAGLAGSAVLRVFTDQGDGSWHQQAKSEVVRGGDAPLAIEADLTNAKRISLLVDFADRGDELDHADWLNARLIR